MPLLTEVGTYILVLLPFAFYWYLWNHPSQWVKTCGVGVDPSQRMATISGVLKVLQIGAVAIQSTWSIPPWYCVAAIVVGQFLNVRVYQLLGTNGVYYGVRFGKPDVPWVDAFPYSVMKDPQYVGSSLSLIGCLCWAPWQYIFLWVVGYIFMMWVENVPPAAQKKNT